jgi:hypothetical protein
MSYRNDDSLISVSWDVAYCHYVSAYGSVPMAYPKLIGAITAGGPAFYAV